MPHARDAEAGRVVGRAPAGGRGRDLGRATTPRWTTSPPTPATPGSGTTAVPRAGSSTRTTGRGLLLPARLPRARPAAAHPQRDPQPRPRPRRLWRTLDGRALLPAAPGCRPRSPSARPRNTSPPRSGSASRPARTARPARSSASAEAWRSSAPAGGRSPKDRPVGGRVRSQVRPRAQHPGAGPPAAAGHVRDPQSQVPRRETVEQRLERWDAQLRAEVAGGLAGVATDVLDLAGQPAEAQSWSPCAVIETASGMCS